MLFETPPKNFKPFAFVLKGFPIESNTIFYAKLKKKAFLNTIEVHWFDKEFNKQYTEYYLDDVEEMLNNGKWRKIDVDIHIF